MISRIFGSVRSAVRVFNRGQIAESSAISSFYILFSLAPLSIIINSVLSNLNISQDTVAKIIDRLVPSEISKVIEDYAAGSEGAASHWLTVTGIFLSLYSLARVINVMRKRMMILYGNNARQSAVKNWISSFFFAIVLQIGIIVSILVLGAGKWFMRLLSEAFGIDSSYVELWLVLRFVLLAAFIFFFLITVYYFLPGVRQNIKDCMVGTFIGMAGWVIFTIGFSFYVDNFQDYSLIYGSLGGIIVLLLWLYFSSAVIFIGALVNSKLWSQRQSNSRNASKND